MKRISIEGKVKATVFLLFFLFPLLPLSAQESVSVAEGSPLGGDNSNFGKRLNKKLSNRYYTTRYDTNYVVRPKEKWMFRPMVRQTANYIHAKGTVNNVWSRYDLHTKYYTTLSLKVNYCGIGAAISFKPEKNNDDYELNLEYHGNRVSLNLGYMRAYSLSGDIELGNIKHLDKDGLSMKEFNLSAYYTFNYRKFSFPAVLSQGYYQRRSAGSFLAGVSFQSGSIRTTDQLKARTPQAPEVHLTFANLALGPGYGYNLVLGNHSQWLLHLSAMPTVVLYRHNQLTVNNDEIKDRRASLNMIFNERAALIYYFTHRFHGGASFIMSNSVYDNDNINVRQNRWLARAFLGVRL